MNNVEKNEDTMGTIQICIGSWGSYNACNSRALGSDFLDLSKYKNWNEIEKHLTDNKWEIDGIDEELFIQDIENDFGITGLSTRLAEESPSIICSYIYKSKILTNQTKNDIFGAYMSYATWNEFVALVDEHGEEWDTNLILYKNYTWDDFGRLMYSENYNPTISISNSPLNMWFDFEGWAKNDYDDCAYLTEFGIIMELN